MFSLNKLICILTLFVVSSSILADDTTLYKSMHEELYTTGYDLYWDVDLDFFITSDELQSIKQKANGNTDIFVKQSIELVNNKYVLKEDKLVASYCNNKSRVVVGSANSKMCSNKK